MLNPAALVPLYEAAKKLLRASISVQNDAISEDRTRWRPSKIDTASLSNLEAYSVDMTKALTLAESPSPVGEARWLVYSRVNNGWLAAKMDGYRVEIANAGRFSLADATRIVGGMTEPTGGDEAGFVVPDPTDYAALSAELAEVRGVLGEVEWNGTNYDLAGDRYDSCPCCGADKDVHAHKPDCKLSAALARAATVKGTK